MTVVIKNTENLSGTTERFFKVPSGLETQTLLETPAGLPESGFVYLYLKENILCSLDELGNETAVSGGDGSVAPNEEVKAFVAGATIGGHRIVIIQDNGTVNYADNSDLTHKTRIIGITTGAVAQEAIGHVRTYGVLVEPTWNWTMGIPIWLSTNGQLTQTPPTTGFLLEIGYPLSATSIFVRIGEPISLT